MPESKIETTLTKLGPALDKSTKSFLEVNRLFQEIPQLVTTDMINTVAGNIDSLVQALDNLKDVARTKSIELHDQSLERFGNGIEDYCSTLQQFKTHLVTRWRSARNASGFPRFWELFGFALRQRTRERIFEPAYQDMLAQHLKARRFSGKWERRWLNFCFAWRTVGLVLSCWGIATWTAAIAIALRLIPPGVKEWVLHLFR